MVLNTEHKAEWERVIYEEAVELFAAVILMRLLGQVVLGQHDRKWKLSYGSEASAWGTQFEIAKHLSRGKQKAAAGKQVLHLVLKLCSRSCKAPLRSRALLGGGGELCAFDSPYQKGFGFIAEVLTAQRCSLPYCAYCKRSVRSGSGKRFSARVLLTINYKCFVYQKVMIAWYCSFPVLLEIFLFM